MELVKTIREKWQRYLKDMAESNEKMWKGRKPSCCEKEKKEESKNGHDKTTL